MKKLCLVLLLVTVAMSGCLHAPQQRLSEDDLKRDASAWPLKVNDGSLFTDNDAAFLSKVAMVRRAKSSIDLSYYIYSDDYSSSYLSGELIAKAKSGVKVRLLVDYETNYARLDLFSMLEQQGRDASGNRNLEVRFYNRPTANIVKDAVFLTMGCPKEKAPARADACSADKFAEIDRLFAQETIDGVQAAPRNISNLDIGNSGLFLSGLYSKNADVLALAVESGQGIDVNALKKGGGTTSAADRENLKNLAKVYWRAKAGNPFQKLAANAELYFVFASYGEKLYPIRNTVTSILPVGRTLGADELRDWDHFTDYLHHKFLLVDGAEVQMGGRNVEDSYHMNPDPLVEKEKTYIFMDTDLYASLKEPGAALADAFSELWNFAPMVARLDEVRQHAPNDFVMNLEYAEKGCASLKGKPEFEPCVARKSEATVHDLASRVAERRREMEDRARIYRERYLPGRPMEAGMRLDPTALLGYLENLPFNRELPADKKRRSYGAGSGDEAKDGKYIHDVWIREIEGICAEATPAQPKRIILHNAYFFPPANLAHSLSRLVDGRNDCSNVSVTVLTNSFETTDLNVVNLVAHQSIKAFTEFYTEHEGPRQAKFEYLEYQKPGGAEFNRSLHSKVSLFGDDLVVGSANADVRSFMMDSNNAMLVRGAPGLHSDYLSFVGGILADRTRVQNLNRYFAQTPRETIKSEDQEKFWAYVERKFAFYRKVDAARKAAARQEVSELMDQAYQMTKESLSSGKRSEQDRFNEQFKPI